MGSLLGVSESASAEFSFFTPSAPPSTYTFKLITPGGVTMYEDSTFTDTTVELENGIFLNCHLENSVATLGPGITSFEPALNTVKNSELRARIGSNLNTFATLARDFAWRSTGLGN